MRIGLLTSTGQSLDAFFPHIIEEWQHAGHEVFCASGRSKPLKVESRLIPSLTRQPSPVNIKAPTALRTWSREHHLDLIITNTATASSLARLVPAVPIVYFCHGLHWASETSPSGFHWQFVERLLARSTAGVITLNSDDAKWFERTAPRIPRLHLEAGVGVETNIFPRSPVPDIDGCHRLCWIGEFTSRKRPNHAIRVVHGLRQQGVPVHLSMLGNGPLLARSQQLVTCLDLTDSISFEGHVPPEPFITSSSLVVHTARWEGLPRVLLESTAIGRPCGAYDVKGVRDIPGVHLAPDGRPDKLAEMIQHILHRRPQAFIPPTKLSSKTAASNIRHFIEGLRLSHREPRCR